MSLEEKIEENTIALEENTTTLNKLIALIKETPVGKFVPVAAPPAVVPGGLASRLTADEKTKEAPLPASTDKVAIPYSKLSAAFLEVIKLLGSGAKAKAAVLDPLGLANLKDNAEKPELFPAIMEKIEAAKAAVKAAEA